MALDQRVYPLIGTSAALATIHDVPQRSDGPNVVVVCGEAGIGKSRLHARSPGNPFIAEELLAAGRDEEVPASLHDILLARASRIDADAEHLVRVPALIGRPVSHDLLGDASKLDTRRLAIAVRQAVNSGLLTVDTVREEYAFRHVLTRDAVRQRILPAEGRRLHAAIAAALGLDPGVWTSASRAAEWAAHVLATGDRVAAFAATLHAARLAAAVYACAAELVPESPHRGVHVSSVLANRARDPGPRPRPRPRS